MMPAVYVLLCPAIMIDLLIVKPVFTWPGLIIVLTGIPVYFLWRWFGGAREGLEMRTEFRGRACPNGLGHE